MKRIFFSFFLFIMVSMIGLQYAQPLLVGKPLQKYFEKEIVTHWRNLTRGVFHLLLEDLKKFPAEERDRRMHHLQSHFGYPVALVDRDRLSLTATELSQLDSDFIVVKNGGSLFYQRIPDTNKVITMGPIQEFDASLQSDLLSWALITLIFCVMSMLWARPFWTKLKKISSAAQAFGTGDFTARAKLPRRSALAPLAGTFNDMAERIQQLISSHKELTRAISHELRTPISRIRFGLEMAQTAHDESERLNYLAGIGQDVDELDELVSELLTYARFDREMPRLNQEELPIASWLLQTIKETGVVSKATVSYQIPQEAETVQTRIAPHHLARALSNLLVNAGKYAENQIIISLEKTGPHCLIHIDDDGPGIPEADREHIFEPFVRLDTSRTRETGGHGLGLAIVKQIVDLHHGKVWTEPSSLGGARFTISLP